MHFNIQHTTSFIKNKFIETSPRLVSLLNPYSQTEIAKISYCSQEDVQEAVQAAIDAQKEWLYSTTGFQRRDKLLKLAEAMGQISEELAYLDTVTNGKPIKDARLDVADSIEVFRYYAGFADKITSFDLP